MNSNMMNSNMMNPKQIDSNMMNAKNMDPNMNNANMMNPNMTANMMNPNMMNVNMNKIPEQNNTTSAIEGGRSIFMLLGIIGFFVVLTIVPSVSVFRRVNKDETFLMTCVYAICALICFPLYLPYAIIRYITFNSNGYDLTICPSPGK